MQLKLNNLRYLLGTPVCSTPYQDGLLRKLLIPTNTLSPIVKTWGQTDLFEQAQLPLYSIAQKQNQWVPLFCQDVLLLSPFRLESMFALWQNHLLHVPMQVHKLLLDQ